AVLHLDRTLQCLHDAGKFNQHAVAHGSDDAAAVLLDPWVDQLAHVSIKARQRPFLISPYQPAIAGDIGSKDGRKPALIALARQRKPPGLDDATLAPFG